MGYVGISIPITSTIYYSRTDGQVFYYWNSLFFGDAFSEKDHGWVELKHSFFQGPVHVIRAKYARNETPTSAELKSGREAVRLRVPL